MAGNVVPLRPRCGPAGKRFPNGAGWLAYFCLGCATLALFWRVQGFSFVSLDDSDYIVDNQFLKLAFIPQGIAWAFTTFRGGNWHPLTWISHMLDYKLFGLDAGHHHLVNVVLHTANALLLLRLLARLTGAFWRSALVAALFALHPLHVESVAWASERKDTLSTLFLFLALAAYLHYAHRRSPGRYLRVILAATLGLLSKPTLVTLPLLLLLLDFWPLGRLRPGCGREVVVDAVKEKIPIFALAALTAGFTLYAPAKLQALTSLSIIPLGERIGNALISYVRYLQLTLWPAGLSVLYPYPETLLRGRAVLSVVALATLSVLAAAFIRTRPAVAIGWLWYVVVLLPMIGIVQVGPQVVADRYTYVALIGIFVAAAWGLPLPQRGRPVRSALWTLVVVSALGGCFLVSWRQVGTWRDSRTLFQHALAVTDKNYYAYVHLGVAFADEGRFEEAVAHLARAREISPAFPLAHATLGAILTKMGRLEEAVAPFSEAVRLDPGSGQAHFEAGLSFAKAGQTREAIAHFSRAAQLMPQSAAAQYNLAKAYGLSGQPELEQEHYRRAIAIDPGIQER